MPAFGNTALMTTVIATMTPTSDLLADRYRLVGLLGRGGMSDVYEAFDDENGTTVAIKIVRSGDPALARRMAQEARALERVEHPGLVRLFDTGLEADQAYLVMELVRGATLADSLQSGPLGAVATAVLGARLADALACVHDHGIVHRDVKPSNILLSDDGNDKLGDFGIARLLDASTLTLAGTTLGTAAYMAPEQLEDHQVGPSADIWSLGIVLLECLTGRRVYEGTPSEVVARRLAGPVPFPEGLPVPWKLVLSGMLDHRPDQRLDGAETAALLATPAFTAPWDPSAHSEADHRSQTVPLDLMALAPEAGATMRIATEKTRVVSSESSARPIRRRSRRWWRVVVAAISIGGLVVGLGFGLGLIPTTHRHSTTASTHGPTTRRPKTAARTASTTTTTSIVPTTIPNAPSALAALVRDLASATEAGTITSGTAQSISGPAQQAVSDVAAGRPNQAASDLQHAAQAITNAVQDGSVSRQDGTVLETDLSTLATVLGLNAAANSADRALWQHGQREHRQREHRQREHRQREHRQREHRNRQKWSPPLTASNWRVGGPRHQTYRTIRRTEQLFDLSRTCVACGVSRFATRRRPHARPPAPRSGHSAWPTDPGAAPRQKWNQPNLVSVSASSPWSE